MRKAKTLEKLQYLAPEVETKIIPAPTDGWDAISPLADMDPKRAPILDNWVPRPGYVELRSGYQPWVDLGVSTPVETLMTYRSATTEIFFAAAGSFIYDITVQSSPTTAVSGLSSGRWQWVLFTPELAPTVMQIVNGSDTLRQYNGTTWSIPTITGLPNSATTANIINIFAHKRRLWYILANTTIAAYMPTDAIQGPIAGSLDMGALWTKGGFLVAMQSWTIDGGSGPQDYALFLSSRGQVSIFSGIDPTDATNWTLTGTFDISPPIGRRCMTRIGSDVAIITQSGVLPISQALPFDPSADRSVAITARIQNAMAQAANFSGSNFGWQLVTFPAQQLAVLNVPQVENQSQVQFVMNTLTGAWCQFKGWNANVFGIYQDDLFFGGNSGLVNQAWTSGLDGTAAIASDMQCAFNWFDQPGRTKRMTLIQPLLTSGGAVSPTLSVDVDFGVSTATAPITTTFASSQWDSAIWDNSLWSLATAVYNKWLSVQAIGHAMAVHLTLNLGGGTGPVGIFDVGVFDTAVFDSGVTAAPLLQVNAFNALIEIGGVV